MGNCQYGKLYIVATPIGNLQDITLRALETLKTVDMIACEDTRNTIKLLTHFDIKNTLVSYHEHNKYDKAKELVLDLRNGKNIAIVTDAGTPIINDPGYELVKEAIDNDIDVTGIPGACACINAITLSGIECKKFLYLGFLPDNKNEKFELLDKYKEYVEAVVIYSSKSQIKNDLSCIKNIFGEKRHISVAREMTKIHEEILRGNVSSICDEVKDKELLGEFVIVIEGFDEEIIENRKKEKLLNISIRDQVLNYIESGLSEKEAIKKVSKERNIDKNEVYKEVKIKEKLL